MKKRLRALRRLYPDLTVTLTRGGHIRLTDSSGRVVAIASQSPSDHRGAKNLQANVRRCRVQSVH